MDYGTFQGIVTLVLLLIFLAIIGWAYSAKRKPAFDEAANLVFDDENTPKGSKE
ncbi:MULTISPECIES: CcoQ/FixQ family Cbb3-type cytochrome c oxidase assembly chaperone [Ferrimonas]|uniref:Cytochrome c oxidase cbb3-type subunit 4 n=1 Tax=Ferrimonas sediminum TaxID=718193 RepID=A0A1G8SES4_9GAMM|nr:MULTISPECIES: CcoQ/FixQ family Cbb3-type cytochrome c oxidase assembly chaperone [Ferrimonas]USD35643.1 CcoQ/FixQ family Cbb3-type cytochrome c oxidase assembly chaperone [Ferrimonas sp. SCSIO 43195]SDJ27701.1 cytochrome c oxidase cbb3-type subunit 4 [Ferrimonas sediminum]